MKSEVVRKENYRGYEILVRELSFDTDETVETISWIPNTWYCGYVVIPANDKFYNASEDLLDTLDVHGGITFDGVLRGFTEYMIGFDCHHVGDDPEVQDADYALSECKRLVDQIKRSNREYIVSIKIDLRQQMSPEAIYYMVSGALAETIDQDSRVFTSNIIKNGQYNYDILD